MDLALFTHAQTIDEANQNDGYGSDEDVSDNKWFAQQINTTYSNLYVIGDDDPGADTFYYLFIKPATKLSIESPYHSLHEIAGFLIIGVHNHGYTNYFIAKENINKF